MLHSNIPTQSKRLKAISDKNKNIFIICGFPGVGKTFATKDVSNEKILFHDSDSSSFSHDIINGERVKSIEFPKNYIDHIKSLVESAINEHQDKSVYILVSTHEAVIKEIQKLNEYTINIVYPDSDLDTKIEFLYRYETRGSDIQFIKNIDTNWSAYLNSLKHASGRNINKITINGDEYLSDYI